MAGGAGSRTACRQWGCVAEHQGQAKLAHSTVPKALVSQAGSWEGVPGAFCYPGMVSVASSLEF